MLTKMIGSPMSIDLETISLPSYLMNDGYASIRINTHQYFARAELTKMFHQLENPLIKIN